MRWPCATTFSYYRKRVPLPARPLGFSISFCKVRPLPTNAKQDLSKVTGTIFLPIREEYSCCHVRLIVLRGQRASRKYFNPGPEEKETEGKRNRGGLDAGPICRTQILRAMEDVMTVILIVVLFVVLKPIVKAVLKGMGITDRWRDR